MKTLLGCMSAALLLVAQVDVSAAAPAARPEADALVTSLRANLQKRGICPTPTGDAAAAEIQRSPTAVRVDQYKGLVHKDTWNETRPDGKGGDSVSSVTAEIWTAAIQAALDQHAVVLIPARPEPYYIDAPLVLASGRRLLAESAAEIRLKPGIGTCMVRNRHMIGRDDQPVSLQPEADRDIVVAGGVWTTLAVGPKHLNGNLRGRSDAKGTIGGAFGVMLFNNVDGLQVKGLTIREGKPFGIQMSVCRNFLIEQIRLVNHRCDGVHINGPASDGIVREVGGVTYDDMVALNAWDWRGSAMSFGPIERLWLQGIRGTLQAPSKPGGPWPPSDGTSQVRLLAGTKHYADGRTLDCDIRDCVFDDLDGLRSIKMYDQPNLGSRDKDFADPIGRLVNLHFRGVVVHRYIGHPLFEIASNVEGMRVENVTIEFDPLRPRDPPVEPYSLVEIGPRSATLKRDLKDPRTWIEIFSPDKDCTVRDLAVSGVRCIAARGAEPRPVDGESLIRVFSQKLNPDYPKTTPKGGTGQGFRIK